MEYINGMPITEYCDKEKISIEDRLKLFIQICEAVQYAHQRGIIHRDIKPSNIIVNVHQGKIIPKMIDFGIAKATSMVLTEKTLFTQQGQLIGTPEYMSPEQADLNIKDIDTRSDIYSLGVVLYELLAGTLPFESNTLREAGYAEIQRIIREVEPPRPSTKLSSLGEDATKVAQRRHIELSTLVKSLHRELEWIPLMAIRKDRDQRYTTASDMAGDVQNYLDGNPLVAGPESVAYRFKKFVKKRKGLVASVSAVAAAIVIGLVVSSAMYFQAEEARDKEAVARIASEEARGIAEKAEKVAEEQREVAEEQAEAFRRALYVNHIAMANGSYHEGNMSRVRELLEACPEDLRGWEWHRLQHISDQSCTTLRGHDEEVVSVAFSPDGKRIVSGDGYGTVKVWDTEMGNELATFRAHTIGMSFATFDLDGKQIISASLYEKAKVWNAATGDELKNIETYEGRDTYCLAISPDRNFIVSGSGDGTIKVWDVVSGSKQITIRAHKTWISDVAFSPDSKLIVSGNRDGTIKVWDASTGAELVPLRGHNEWINDVKFSPDSKRIVSCSDDNTVKVWDAATGNELMTLRGHEDWIYSASFSPDGKRIVSGSDDKTVKVWDVETGAELMTLQGHEEYVHSVLFSPDGERIVSGDVGGVVRVWDAVIRPEITTLRSHDAGDEAGRIAYSPDGKRIISANRDETIKVWDVETGAELMTLRGHEGFIWSASFSPYSKRIVSGSGDKTVKVWDAATGNELMTLRGHEGTIWSAAFSPDGKRIVSGSGDNTVKVWDAATGNELMTLRGHEGTIWSTSFSPDGKRIVSGSLDYTVKVWDAATGNELMTLRGHEGYVYSASFSSDGNTIAAGCSNGTIKLWESTPPAGGYRLRQDAEAARMIVDQMYEKASSYYEVVDELKADERLDEAVHKFALQIANSRREDALTLNNKAWEVVSLPGGDIKAYQKALKKSTTAKDLEPDNWSFLNTLGVGQYRVGLYEQALVTLTKAGKMRADNHLEPDLVNVAFCAMALYRLDRTKEAQTVLNRLHVQFENTQSGDNLWAEPWVIEWAETWAIEAEKLIAGEKSRLYLVWENIENGQLKDARQGLKELQQMEDTGTAKGAVKALSRAYNNRGKTKMSGGETAEAISDFEAAVRIDQNNAGALNELAWLYATCQMIEFRDGAKAVETATKACELTGWKNHGYVGTLAAAYSETGDFESAVKRQKEAIELLTEDERAKWQGNYEIRLKLYESHKPYHMGNPWSFSEGELLSWWKFDEVEGRKVIDSSGNGLDGKLVGDAKIISDPQRGNVLSLDGDGDYVDCGNSPAFNITGAITVAAWIKAEASIKEWQAIVTKGDTAWRIQRDWRTDGIEFACTGVSGSYFGNIIGTAGVDNNRWHHVAGVYDGSKLCLYVDGTVDTCAEASGSITINESNVHISNNADVSRHWNGLIDDVRIYSYALSAEEISELHQSESVKTQN
jgi:WD40 repeat protein/Flp pilus assembly protein TadD